MRLVEKTLISSKTQCEYQLARTLQGEIKKVIIKQNNQELLRFLKKSIITPQHSCK